MILGVYGYFSWKLENKTKSKIIYKWIDPAKEEAQAYGPRPLIEIYRDKFQDPSIFTI